VEKNSIDAMLTYTKIFRTTNNWWFLKKISEAEGAETPLSENVDTLRTSRTSQSGIFDNWLFEWIPSLP
jgi:hypothetical protein